MKQERRDQHILLVIHAYSTHYNNLINRAHTLLTASVDCHFSILLAVPDVPKHHHHTYGPVAVMQRELLEQGKENMDEIADIFAVPAERQMICFGPYEHELMLIKRKQRIDRVLIDKEQDKISRSEDLLAMMRKVTQESSSLWSRFFFSYFHRALVGRS